MSDTKSRIPKISNRRLKALMRRIKPVARFAEGARGVKFRDVRGALYYVHPRHPRKQSFGFDPKPQARARGLFVIDRVATLHTGSIFFKPSVAEVLAFIQGREDIAKIVAFEVVNGECGATESGYHNADAILYSREPRRRKK